MSVLGIIEKLLDGFEVEWKKFDDVGVFLRGKRFVKADMKSEGVPCIHYGEMYTHFGVHAKEAKSFLDESVASKLRVANPGDVVIVAAGETIEDIGNGTAWLGESDIVFHDACFSFKSSLDPKYVSYYLRTNLFKEQIRRSVSSGKISSINAKGLGKATIPIPCPDNPEKSLAIQAEIVRILDAFTAMTAELTAELNMRKKQYNYYRDQLLSFEEGDVEWKNLEDVASFRRGSFPQPYGNSEWYDGEGCMPFVQVADVADFGFTLHQTTKQKISKLAQPKSVFVEKGTVVVSLQGTIGRVAITQYDSYVDRTLAIFTSYKEDINKKYFAHQLKAKFDLEKEFARGSTLKTITKQEFSKFQIPIPPIEEQNRIVALLDKFDTLTHSIKEGLPREIELRQKQYEYYRDLLLSFPASPAGGPKSHSDEAA
ncbi:TPA: restriction endonuclease subunit S [Vibrio cholerae]|nr:restriction endonuclease subunit S [Vibrio cholerae]